MSRTLELREHEPLLLLAEHLTSAHGESILQRYGKQIDVEFPTPRTRNRWRLTSQGWVGAFRVDAETTLVVTPKVPVNNLGRMLLYAYDLPINTFAGLVNCSTMVELYNQLARILAREILGLLRQGLYQSYQPLAEDRSAIRGRIDVDRLSRSGPRPVVRCRFSNRTADVSENQLLLWTVSRVLRSGLCSDDVQRELRECYRHVSGVVSLVPITSSKLNIRYNRLSERYKVAHALCRLFLETGGPVPGQGDVATVPFLLEMPRLFETFVAHWLRSHCGNRYRIESQERSIVGDNRRLDFYIDIVLYDRAIGKAVCVLDTKYKNAEAPSTDDVSQVSSYALLKECDHAGLVYPTGVTGGWEGQLGRVRTFRATFDIGRNLDTAGAEFLSALTRRIGSTIDASLTA